MSTLFSGAMMLIWSLATVVDGAVPPVGSPNTFVEISLVATNVSIGFPAVELAPVSLIADGMVTFIIPCISLDFERPFSRLLCFWCAFSQGWRLYLILVALCFSICVSMCRWQAKSHCFSFVLVFVGVVWDRSSTGLHIRVQ